jgi:uncharacterized protein YacL
MKIINKILYFILTVVALGSMGVWLPLAIDYFKSYSLNKETLKILPGNILTYCVSLFFIAILDRIIHIIKDESCKHKITELLVMGFVIILCAILTYFSFRSINFEEFDKATKYALIATFLAYIVWWIANWKDEKVDPFDSLGGKLLKE